MRPRTYSGAIHERGQLRADAVIGGEPFWLLTTGRVDVVSVFNPATGFNDFLDWSASAPQTDLCGLLAA